MANEYGRALGGKRLKMPKPMDRGKNYSIIGAVGLMGVIAMLYGKCTTDGAIFLEFIKNHLVKKLRSGYTVFMDNVQFHKSEEIRKAIEKVGAKLIFLPPYSPDLSPIENMWSKIKTVIRKLMPRDSASFHSALVTAVSELKDEDFEE